MTESDQTPSADKQPPMPLGKYAAVAIFLMVVVGASFAYQQMTSVYHLATVQPGVLYRDGARSERELQRAVERVHAKTVVCLVDDRELNDPKKPQFKAEEAYLKQQGIAMERIPVKLGGWPNTPDVQKFLAIVNDKKKQPVLVHCAQGVRRTAMMVAAFQETVLGFDKDRAKGEILTFGHSDNTVNDIRRFIDGYDPKTQTVTLDVK
ncbi:MAG TPA: hypothetical protein VFE47_20495 [Tepidisphaeraceae bacterium]|jgi:protein tyrosine phosphatase (PTP) superfamily phosphohydrolase (DUF442 family)|nr:hypothetical protein [Tepidisphaeraceae bacterium]